MYYKIITLNAGESECSFNGSHDELKEKKKFCRDKASTIFYKDGAKLLTEQRLKKKVCSIFGEKKLLCVHIGDTAAFVPWSEMKDLIKLQSPYILTSPSYGMISSLLTVCKVNK